MSNGAGRVPPIETWPPPPPRAMARMLSFITAGGAATAGFLGCCPGLPNACSSAALVAGVLALLSLVFNLWDFFQNRPVAANMDEAAKQK